MLNKKINFFFIIICLIQLFYIFYSRSGFQQEVFKDPFKETSGIQYALPVEVIEMNEILKDLKLLEFNLSETINNNTYLYQRSVEFNYPIRINKKLETYFFLKEEEFRENCNILESRKYLKLIQC